jgi:hypothetical protein
MCEPRMSCDRTSHEEELQSHWRVAAYEAHLTALERELPGLERELARRQQKSVGRVPAGRDLSC